MVFLAERNMKRQFFRVKQLADQTFARAEKTEVLNDDLVSKEKRVELLRQVCAGTSKKLKDCIQGQGTDGASIDKRLRKTPQFQLGSSMDESAGILGKESMLADALDLCGKMHMEFANILVEYEIAVERLVLGKFIDIVDNDVPNIMKQRKQLNKLTLDYDSARTRHQTAARHSAPALGSTKIDGLKEECEDAWTKMEQCRDQLAIEFYTLLAKEVDLSQGIYQLLQSQQEYHKKSLNVLERCIPRIEKIIESHADKPIYGMPLEEHLKITERKIALPLEACICWLVECGLHEEGLLRIAGSISKVKKLKSSFNVGVIDMKEYEPHAVAGALKHYLRELPEPLMTNELYDRWMNTARITDKEARLQAMQAVLVDLKPVNYNNLRYIIKFLAKLSASQDSNKMSTQNIAIVMAPNLIWTKDEEQSGLQMGLANTHSSIVDLLISHADYFFPGEEEFFLGLINKSQFETDEMGSYCGAIDDVNDFEDLRPMQDSCSAESVEVPPALNNLHAKNNGSPKPAGSPKFARRPKKPQAPKIPPPPKERFAGAAMEPSMSDAAKPNVSPVKPCLPAKPRHERHSSNASVDLTTLSEEETTSVIGFETKDEAKSLDAMMLPGLPPRHHRRNDSGSSGEWPKVTPRSIQPKLAREAPKVENIERSDGVDVGLRKPGGACSTSTDTKVPLTSPTDTNNDTPLKTPPSPAPVKKSPEKQDSKHAVFEKDLNRCTPLENLDKHPQLQPRASVVLGPPPERPPRPVIPQDSSARIEPEPVSVSISSSSKEKNSGAGISILRALGLHSSHEDIGAKSQPASTRTPRDGTQSLDRTAKWKQPYVNISNVLGAGGAGDSYDTAVKVSEPVKVVSPDVTVVAPLAEPDDLDTCTGPPPERPEKYDKAKVVPPGRPEKSDRLRALLVSQDHNKSGKTVLVSKKGTEMSQGGAVMKEKPARPPYLPSALPNAAVKADSSKSSVDGEKNVSKDAASPLSSLYPSLSELGDVKTLDSSSPLPRAAVPTEAPAPNSPMAPKRPPRPQPRPPPVPVAKPRSCVQPEQTHL